MKRKKVEPDKPAKNKGGRPRRDITYEQVMGLAAIHCTEKEIASYLKCSVSTITERFSAALREGWDQGQTSLKRKMHEKALAGDTQMLIWLSKQRLGYRDKQPDEVQQINFNVITHEVPRRKEPETIDIKPKEIEK